MTTKLLFLPFFCVLLSFINSTSIHGQKTTLGISLRSGHSDAIYNSIAFASRPDRFKFSINYGLRAEHAINDRIGLRMSLYIQRQVSSMKFGLLNPTTGLEEIFVFKSVISYLHFPIETYINLGKKLQIIGGLGVDNYIKTSSYVNNELIGAARDYHLKTFQLGASLGLDYLLFDQNYWDMKIGAYANSAFSNTSFMFWGLQLTTSFKFPS